MAPPDFAKFSHRGFTWREVVITLGVLACLFIFFAFWVQGVMIRAQMTSQLSNMKQLHLATQQMALDGRTTKDPSLGWPGDIGGTFTNFVAQLVPSYLTTNDICKLLSAPGVMVSASALPGANTNGILIYATHSNSPANTIFLSTANFTNTPSGGLPLSSDARPFGRHGFVVFYQGDQGQIQPGNRAGDSNVIGAYAPLCR